VVPQSKHLFEHLQRYDLTHDSVDNWRLKDGEMHKVIALQAKRHINNDRTEEKTENHPTKWFLHRFIVVCYLRFQGECFYDFVLFFCCIIFAALFCCIIL
jgi:hypothetical protein